LFAALAPLAANHADTVCPSRTHGQHALPITFGFKGKDARAHPPPGGWQHAAATALSFFHALASCFCCMFFFALSA
jgi:hypothetical protein